MSFAPYEPPVHARDARPVVIRLYRVYAAAMALLSLAFLGLAAARGFDAIALVLASAPLVLLFAVATFAPFKPWGSTVGLVAIGLGLAGVTVIFAAPLLFFWFKPNVKAAFARL